MEFVQNHNTEFRVVVRELMLWVGARFGRDEANGVG